MQNEEKSHLGYVQRLLPWIMGAASLVLYLFTLNHWVSLNSLQLISKISGWDAVPPLNGPLLYLITYPIRLIAPANQPIALNIFTAVCAALTAVILARSVSLLPHDRTHEQRQRERSEFSLLTIPSAWLPPIFATLALVLELTMWENSVVGTGEILDVLIFAYLIRCLLEFRISQNNLWLYKFALVYGLGTTNNYALIAYFPFFLIALIAIKGLPFFRLQFLGTMFLCGLAGLTVYFVLPAVYHGYDATYGYWELFRTSLSNQKTYVLAPSLRNRAFILALTSVLPVIVMGIRWPSSFGDTSATGSAVTNAMFRVIHVMFLAATVFITLDQKFSPRALGFGIPFLTYYYLGALAIGYYSGYALLVFGHTARKSWKRSSSIEQLLNPILLAGTYAAAVALPAYLLYRNFPVIRADNGLLLKSFAEEVAGSVPKTGAILLADEGALVALLESQYPQNDPNRSILVSTKQLELPLYQDQLRTKFPTRWPKLDGIEPKLKIEGMLVQQMISELARTNQVYYLQPSFGYFFERVQQEPQGLVYRLSPAPTNQVILPTLTDAQIQANNAVWTKLDPLLDRLEKSSRVEATDAHFAASYFSRGLNHYGVQLQKAGKLAEAGKLFDKAAALNTNNIPANVNAEFNGLLKAGKPLPKELVRITEDKFGKYRTWDAILSENGPFDEPSYAFVAGDAFLQQALYRQAAVSFERIKELMPESLPVRLSLGRAYLFGRWPDQALQAVRDTRTYFASKGGLTLTNELEFTSLEAGVYFAKTNFDAAEKLLKESLAQHPDEKILLESLSELYQSTRRYKDAIAILDQQLAKTPDNLRLRLAKADIMLKAENFSGARAEVDQVLRLSSNNPAALLFRAYIALQAKEYNKGLDDVQKVLAMDPENMQALIYDGIFNLETKQYDRGLPSLNKAVKLQPKNWVARQNRAVVNLQGGHLDDAKRDYQFLAKIFPDNYAIYYGLAEIAYRQKKQKEALKNYEDYLRSSPEQGTTEQVEERKQVIARVQELKAAK